MKSVYSEKAGPYRQTYFGISAVMTIWASAATGEPALVIVRPFMATLPWEIQDWITFLLCSGCCSTQASSSRLFLPCNVKSQLS